MSFKIEIVRDSEEKKEKFEINAISNPVGVKLRLMEYQLEVKATGRKKRWAVIGNDGTFMRRDSFIVPDDVIEEARQKVAESIFPEKEMQ